jgi:hypothetical protein
MPLRTAITARNTMIDAFAALLNSGRIDIYDGSQPATPETAITSQVLLARCVFGSAAFAAASSASAAANAITPDSDADATGTASWARITTSGATAEMDVTVTATGGGGNIEMNTVSIQQHAQVSITAFTLTQATS